MPTGHLHICQNGNAFNANLTIAKCNNVDFHLLKEHILVTTVYGTHIYSIYARVIKTYSTIATT